MYMYKVKYTHSSGGPVPDLASPGAPVRSTWQEGSPHVR